MGQLIFKLLLRPNMVLLTTHVITKIFVGVNRLGLVSKRMRSLAFAEMNWNRSNIFLIGTSGEAPHQ